LGTFKGLEKKYPNGFWEIDGVPLIDVFGSAIKLTEILVTWKRQGLPWISRAGYYTRITSEALESGHDIVADIGSYWDC
jgi:hypothetical protein